MMCTSCNPSFLANPANSVPIFLSLIVAISLIVLLIRRRSSMSNRTKLYSLYGILLSALFPIAYYSYRKSCGPPMLSCEVAKSLGASLIGTIAIIILIGFFAMPYLYTLSSRAHRLPESHPWSKFVRRRALAHGIRVPTVHLLDNAVPSAFSYSHLWPRIFITVGLAELLKAKEMEAVLLHELGHIQSGSSLITFTNSLFRLLTPLRHFNVLHQELHGEEYRADAFTLTAQRTPKHLEAAKQRLRTYFEAESDIFK